MQVTDQYFMEIQIDLTAQTVAADPDVGAPAGVEDIDIEDVLTLRWNRNSQTHDTFSIFKNVDMKSEAAKQILENIYALIPQDELMFDGEV